MIVRLIAFPSSRLRPGGGARPTGSGFNDQFLAGVAPFLVRPEGLALHTRMETRMSDTPAQNSEAPTTQALSDETLEQVTGGVGAPGGTATGQVSDYLLEIDGVFVGVTAGKKNPLTALVNNENIPK
jgi:hypothetical protein